MELIGLYLIGSVLLVLAGVAKAIRPGDTARALTEVLPGRLHLQGLVRAGAAAEALIGAVAFFIPRPFPAALVCASYLGFAAYVAYVRQRRGPLATCGCFGQPDTPATWLHVAINVVLATAAGVVAAQSNDVSTLRSVLTTQPWGGLPLLLIGAVGVWLTYQALALLPTLDRRPTAPGRSEIMTLSTTLVERSSSFLERRLSRRNVINRSAFVGSAVAVGAGLDLALKPGTAYGQICECGNAGCGCGSTCCSGFTDFCCSVTGFNFCPSNTMMGGWWMADNSSYCDGPRYYMDCNATCSCDNGCSGGFPFCEPGCDLTGGCGCGPNGCDSFLTSCLQFRYGQCNQDIPCMGRIVCRVVACVPPWTIDPTCTTAVAVDNGTAEQNEPCWTPAPPCPTSTPTNCQTVTMLSTMGGDGYGVVTAFGKLFTYGDFVSSGDASNVSLDAPIVAAALRSNGSYWFAATDGGVFAFGNAPYQGSMGGKPLNAHIVGMAPTASGNGYWLVAADGGIFSFGDATFLGSMGGRPLNSPDRGHGAHPDRSGLLARGSGWRHLCLWGCTLPRLDGRPPAQPTHRRHGGHRHQRGLLARGRGRRHLLVWRRRIRRIDGQHPPEHAHRRHGSVP